MELPLPELSLYDQERRPFRLPNQLAYDGVGSWGDVAYTNVLLVSIPLMLIF